MIVSYLYVPDLSWGGYRHIFAFYVPSCGERNGYPMFLLRRIEVPTFSVPLPSIPKVANPCTAEEGHMLMGILKDFAKSVGIQPSVTGSFKGDPVYGDWSGTELLSFEAHPDFSGNRRC